MKEPFELCEEDRDFVAAALHQYAIRSESLLSEISCISGVAGNELKNKSERARCLAEQINPPHRDMSIRDGMGRGMILGLKFPKQ